MPISHNHKCIFIHVPKCAGTSIEYALEMHGDKTDIGLKPYINQKYDFDHLFGAGLQHLTIQEIRSIVSPKIFNSYFKFAFVRNPWDRLVSYITWNHRNKNKDNWNNMETVELSQHMFDIEIANILSKGDLEIDQNHHLKEQWKYICDDGGTLQVDYVGKYEDLLPDWNSVCNELKINKPLEIRMKSNHKPFNYYFDYSTREKIEKIYLKDIDFFNYKF